MKILMIAPTPFFSDRGTHIRILEEALALEKRGHSVTVATYHVGSDIPDHLGSKIDVRRIRRLLFWYKKLEAGPDWQKIILDMLLIKKALFLARTQKPDIIHAHLHEGVLIGWLVQKILFWRGIRLVADFHGSLTKEMVSHSYLQNGWLKRMFRAVEHFVDNLGDAAVTSSEENTREIAEIRKDGRVETVLDGVSVDRYDATPDKLALRKSLGLPEQGVLIAYAGALIANKGIGCLLEAIPKVLALRSEAKFLIIGFPYDQIRETIENASWRENVFLAEPYMSQGKTIPYFELPKWLLSADIGVDPKDSSTAQASGKMLQYMGAGLPVVCFDRVNNREYLDGGGMYATSSSAQGLAEAIVSAFDATEDERKIMGAKNRNRAKLLGYDASAKQLEQLYASLDSFE